MTRPSWFRRLLALFPADFRADFGSAMEADFHDQQRDVSSRGRRATVSLWVRTIGGFLRVGPREHAAQIAADVRYGFRLAVREPASTLTSALVLALGIAAVTGGFTVVDAFLLRPLPFADPDRLVHVWTSDRLAGVEKGRSSWPDVEVWAGAHGISGIAAFNYTEEDLTGNGRPERVAAARVSANVFEVLGVRPRIGRGFVTGEDSPGSPPVAVVSLRFAQQRYGDAEFALHRIVEVGSRRHTIVGVMPPTFVFPLPTTEIWLPYAFDPVVHTWDARSLQAVARLAPGVATIAAEQELASLTRTLAMQHGDSRQDRGVRFEPLRNALNFADEGFRVAGPVMLLAACLILFAACANVSSVLLGRALTRAREVAVRSAVGASRLRLVRQFLFESGTLAVAALGFGLLLGQWWLWWLQGMLPVDLYRVGDIAIGARTALVACAATAGAVLLAACIPAFRFGRTDLVSVLRLGGGGSTASRRASRVLNGLLAAQVALSVALLATALAAIGVVRSLSGHEPGFDRERVLTMKFLLGADRYPQADALRAFYARALDEVRGVTGVETAALVNFLPLNHETSLLPYARSGEPSDAGTTRRTAINLEVSEGYFRTMGIPLRDGRDFDARDTNTGLPVAIVNRTLASRLWADQSPIGQPLALGATGSRVTVVGVVDDARHRELVGEPEPIVYRPLEQVAWRYARVIVRTSRAPLALADSVQAAIWRADPALPLTEVRTLDQVVVDFLLPQRAMTISMASMGAAGLLITALGLYGLLTVMVAQSRREIGVRMALGAGRHRVVRAIVSRSVTTTGVGLLIGFGLSAAVTRSLTAVLPGARPADPFSMAATLLLLALVALAASFVPARRATRIDPLIVLRTS